MVDWCLIRRSINKLCQVGGGLCLTFSLSAARPEYTLEIKNHLFYPAELVIPAGEKVKLIIYNHDDTPEEFDSFALNREKVIFARRKAQIYVGPLPPGRYDFFGEYNPNSARGTVIVVASNCEGAEQC